MVLVVALWRVPESHSHGGDAGSGVDVWGALLATSGLAGVVYVLIEAAGGGWRSYHVMIALAVGVAALALFIAVEARSGAPMLPLSLFRIRNFAGANLLTLLLYAALGGGMYFLPLNLIQVQGYSSTAAGGALLPLILIMFALSRWAGQLVDRVGSKLPLVIGPLVAAAGFAWFAVPGVGGHYWLTFFPAVVVLGLGMTVTVAPLTTTVMNAVEPDRAGIASGVNNAVSRTAGLLAIASFGIVMARAFETSLGTQLAALHVPHEVAIVMWEQRGKLAGASVPDYVDADTAALLTAAVKHAFVLGYRWVMLLCAALALLSAVSAWVLIDARPRLARDPA
jgi:predicted MFS family arabinose efflux permease